MSLAKMIESSAQSDCVFCAPVLTGGTWVVRCYFQHYQGTYSGKTFCTVVDLPHVDWAASNTDHKPISDDEWQKESGRKQAREIAYANRAAPLSFDPLGLWGSPESARVFVESTQSINPKMTNDLAYACMKNKGAK